MSEKELPPRKHTFSVAQLQSIVAAATSPRVAGRTVATVTIAPVQPGVRFMADAVAVEFAASSREGGRHQESLIVGDDGTVLAHLSDAEEQ
jgi:hypothetical protein